jgi:hypothetical protein
VSGYPFAPIETRARHLCADPDNVTEIARVLGLSRTQVYRYRTNGVNARAADELAVHIGFHPLEIWPDWYPINIQKEAS